ncbi:jph-1 [Pristionchus pacificus]|uniref:Jph-1 n=1 Tax=Pristionchus pacificus TaxID=54126 RepID=A0A2A6BN52_PRIPA|nr:jph-1 [Pristionchus pacificus]|eukprot:PDM67339.1 jph-1 [Pristionchus pacificus]
MSMNGGRFEFDDGGSYCGGWEEAKAHGHGVCTGPQGKGEYSGAWHYGFEVSGEYRWASGNVYSGQWQNGRRHGLGQETRGRWRYMGDWTSGSKGRYGVRSSMTSQARYAGTWSANYHDGYGTEVYVDGGMYQGQWLRGMRHGFGVRKSAVHSTAARLRRANNHVSLTSLRSGQLDMNNDEEENKNNFEGRGGFVLKASSNAPQRRRRSLSERSLAMKRSLLSGLRIKKQHSTGDIHQKVSNYTTGSMMSCASDDSNGKEIHHADVSILTANVIKVEEEQIDDNAVESYYGEWKNDGRSGYGICERSDGLKYQGEWAKNMKNGYGVTTMKDGTKEEGKYKDNVLIMSMKKKGVLFVRSSRLRERVEGSVEAAARSADIAKQKADIAASRTSTAKERAEQAAQCARQAREDSDMARIHAKQFDPNFKQPGTEGLRRAANSVDSPRTQLSSDLSSRSSKPPSFDHTGDMATDPLAYGNHVAAPQPRLPHQHVIEPSSNGTQYGWRPTKEQSTQYGWQVDQVRMEWTKELWHYIKTGAPCCGSRITTSSASSHLLHVNPPHQVSFDESSFPSTSTGYNHQGQQNYVQQGGQPPQQQHQYHNGPQEHKISYQQQASGPYQRFVSLPPLGPSTSSASTTPGTASARSYYDQPHPSNRDSIASSQPSTSGATPKESLVTPPSPKTVAPPRNELQSSRVSLVQADDHYEQYGMRSRRAARDESKGRAPRELSNGVGLSRRSTLAGAHDRSPLGALPQLRTLDATAEGEDQMGSLPNLARLEETNLRMNREEAARLASDRRQQMFREEEDRELLRANPLRWFVHPTFRNMLRRWKVPILLVVANLALLILFYSLVTYEKKKSVAAASKKH